MIVKKRLYGVLLLFFILGCTPSQKAQSENLINEHTNIINSVTLASGNADSIVIHLNQDHQSALKDNDITISEHDILAKECEDRKLLHDRLNEEIFKFKKYLGDKKVLLTQEGVDVEEDQRLLKEAEDRLAKAESLGALCSEILGTGTKESDTEEVKHSEQITPEFGFKKGLVNTAGPKWEFQTEEGTNDASCGPSGTWIGPGTTGKEPLYEVKFSGTLKGPPGTQVKVGVYFPGTDQRSVDGILDCGSWPKVSSSRLPQCTGTETPYDENGNPVNHPLCLSEIFVPGHTNVEGCVRTDGAPESTVWTFTAHGIIEPFAFRDVNYKLEVNGFAQAPWWANENNVASFSGDLVNCDKICSKIGQDIYPSICDAYKDY